jgi:hypothetical protein
MVYDIPEKEKRALATAKVESQFARALAYVDKVDARVVVPSAGPPCFLDPELFHLNMVTGEEVSIFRINQNLLHASPYKAAPAFSTCPALLLMFRPAILPLLTP